MRKMIKGDFFSPTRWVLKLHVIGRTRRWGVEFGTLAVFWWSCASLDWALLVGIIFACVLALVEEKLDSSRLSKPSNSALIEFKVVVNSCWFISTVPLGETNALECNLGTLLSVPVTDWDVKTEFLPLSLSLIKSGWTTFMWLIPGLPLHSLSWLPLDLSTFHSLLLWPPYSAISRRFTVAWPELSISIATWEELQTVFFLAS